MAFPDRKPRTFEVERRGGPGRHPLKAPKPKRWSHQELLENLKGKNIVIVETDGAIFPCQLVEADQFSLLVRDVQMGQSALIVRFKSDIRGFYEAPTNVG